MTEDLERIETYNGSIYECVYTAKVVRLKSISMPLTLRIIDHDPYRSTFTLISKTNIGDSTGPHRHSSRVAELLERLPSLDTYEPESSSLNSCPDSAEKYWNSRSYDWDSMCWAMPRPASGYADSSSIISSHRRRWGLYLQSPSTIRNTLFSLSSAADVEKSPEQCFQSEPEVKLKSKRYQLNWPPDESDSEILMPLTSCVAHPQIISSGCQARTRGDVKGTGASNMYWLLTPYPESEVHDNSPAMSPLLPSPVSPFTGKWI